MSAPPGREVVLPTRRAKRRLLVGRLFLFVLCTNFVLALIGGWALSGPATGLTRFRLGMAGWAAVLFLAVSLLVVPLLAPIVLRLLRPPPEENAP